MTVILDASVILKWFFKPERESDTDKAVDVLRAFTEGRSKVFVPAHCTAEVCAVLATEAPEVMRDAFHVLAALEIPVLDQPDFYARAMMMSQDLNHHLFDTLYHAAALETAGAVFLTADERYVRAAKHYGSIERLSEWTAS